MSIHNRDFVLRIFLGKKASIGVLPFLFCLSTECKVVAMLAIINTPGHFGGSRAFPAKDLYCTPCYACPARITNTIWSSTEYSIVRSSVRSTPYEQTGMNEFGNPRTTPWANLHQPCTPEVRAPHSVEMAKEAILRTDLSLTRSL